MTKNTGFLSILFLSVFLTSFSGFAQSDSIPTKDSVVYKNALTEVFLSAFEQAKHLSEQPASISYISSQTLDRFNSESILSAMNAVPGVRMEERSPGSYRVNIRGSSLRSPFGVRNVKTYFNGIPFTDPGGNTYLNQLSFADMHSLEIIKGPAGSSYGAGTGGVILINSPLFSSNSPQHNGLQLHMGGGSYGLLQTDISMQWGKERQKNALRYTDKQSDGYRDHTQLHQQTASYETQFSLNEKEKLDAFFHYTNLFYQTPGALTKDEFDENPRAARPSTGALPSAKNSNASVQQKAFLVGLNYTYQFTPYLKNTTALYGAYTDFINPTFLNYEYRKEPHFGGRTVFQYKQEKGSIKSNYSLGGEIQQGFFSQKDFEIADAQPDKIQTFDRVNELTAFVFAQADFTFPEDWEVNIGLSYNHRNLHFERHIPINAADFKLNNTPEWAPRIAISKKLNPDTHVFASVSKGFSPPTVAEILPSTTDINRDLKAENGLQYEIGSKGSVFKDRLYYDLSLFYTRLSQSISSRRDESGADYFVNAGNAHQKGLEASFNYIAYQHEQMFMQEIQVWSAVTLFDFKYKDYRDNDDDFSGKYFPGSARTTFAGGLDFKTAPGLQAHLTYQHTSKIPLNDANSIYTKAYNLLGLRLTYPINLANRTGIKLFISGDNLLDQRYSLGDDINAFGGRYYNVAPGISFQAGVKINLDFKQS